MNRTILYPDYDDREKSVLYYAEFIPFKEKLLCKIYKREWLNDVKPDDALPDYSFGNEVHPWVLFEFEINEYSEPTSATAKFMVDAMNERYYKLCKLEEKSTP